jgi:hypothetical protein
MYDINTDYKELISVSYCQRFIQSLAFKRNVQRLLTLASGPRQVVNLKEFFLLYYFFLNYFLAKFFMRTVHLMSIFFLSANLKYISMSKCFLISVLEIGRYVRYPIPKLLLFLNFILELINMCYIHLFVLIFLAVCP